MKLGTSLFAFVLLFFSARFASADNFLSPKSKPTFYHSAALQQYVNRIAEYQPETVDLKLRLQETILYYKKIHIAKTIKQSNNTIDCIPFVEQPALINNPELVKKMLPSVKEITKSNIRALKKMKGTFEVNPAIQCPVGSVAILRPSETMLTSKIANKKKPPDQHPSQYSWRTHGHYSHEIGADNLGNFVSISTEASQAYFKGPQNQFVASNHSADHSLDQFWFLNHNYQQSGSTYSVEFGIIASAYFTSPASTSIFVFASIDDYGTDSCYNVSSSCPYFVQFPGTITLGAPTNTQIDYIFQVTHTTLIQHLNAPAYYLTLGMHDSSSKNPNNSSSILLGYYADSIYPLLPNVLPQYFSAGAEVYADQPFDGTLMYGNYMIPYVGYDGPLQIAFTTENNNYFPYYTSTGPSPYGLIWRLGQTAT